MKSISSVDDLHLVVLESSELVNTNSLFDSYIRSWSTAFNRQNFEDRLRWIFSFYTSSILLINSNNTVVGGLNAHHWSTHEYALFNNLFVLPGVSDKPLSLYLINTLFAFSSKPSIGFPNQVAMIPYRRCKFKTLTNYSRLTFSLHHILDTSFRTCLSFTDTLYSFISQVRNSSYVSGRTPLPSQTFFRQRYSHNLHDRNYYSIVCQESDDSQAIALVSHYFPANKLHILYFDYTDIYSALSVLSNACQYAQTENLVVDCVFNISLESELLDRLCIHSSVDPIIGKHTNSIDNYIIRDGDNDVY